MSPAAPRAGCLPWSPSCGRHWASRWRFPAYRRRIPSCHRVVAQVGRAKATVLPLPAQGRAGITPPALRIMHWPAAVPRGIASRPPVTPKVSMHLPVAHAAQPTGTSPAAPPVSDDRPAPVGWPFRTALLRRSMDSCIFALPMARTRVAGAAPVGRKRHVEVLLLRQGRDTHLDLGEYRPCGPRSPGSFRARRVRRRRPETVGISQRAERGFDMAAGKQLLDAPIAQATAARWSGSPPSRPRWTVRRTAESAQGVAPGLQLGFQLPARSCPRRRSPAGSPRPGASSRFIAVQSTRQHRPLAGRPA